MAQFYGCIARAVLAGALAAGTTACQPNASAPSAAPAVRSVHVLPEGQTAARLPVAVIDVSRDGTRVAYVADNQIYVRDLAAAEPRRVPGAEGAPGPVSMPKLSPDGEWLAYVEGPAPPALKKIPVAGGAPQTLVRPIVPQTPDWDERGMLLFVGPAGIMELSPDGGEPRLVVAAREGEALASPRRLPGGDAVLFSATTAVGTRRWDDAQIFVHSPASGERTEVWRGGGDARYVSSGHLVYAQGNALFAIPFDLDGLRVTGSPVAVVEGGLQRSPNGLSDTAQYAMADTGTLVYLDLFVPPAPRRALAWVDRDGRQMPLPVEPGDYTTARVSPDGSRAVLVAGSSFPADNRPSELRVLDLGTGSTRQLRLDFTVDGPVWSRDGARIYFRAQGGGAPGVYSISTDGGTPEQVAASVDGFALPLPWSLSPDGRTLAVVNGISFQEVHIAALSPLDGNPQFSTLLSESPLQTEPMISPNGAWLAYYEVPPAGAAGQQFFIRPFPNVAGTPLVAASGSQPVFAADGTELFYFEGDGIAAVSLDHEPELAIGAPRTLVRGQYWYGVGGPDGALGRAWDVHPDGQRFLMILMPEGVVAERDRIHVVENWLDEGVNGPDRAR